jgi:hypothetical protein
MRVYPNPRQTVKVCASCSQPSATHFCLLCLQKFPRLRYLLPTAPPSVP